MKSPGIYKLSDLHDRYDPNHERVKINNGWYPARPLGMPGIRPRLRAAWLVLTGRADAVIWPGGQ